MHLPRAFVLVLPLAALVLLPGCPALTNTGKLLGVVRRPHLELTDTIPADFQLVVHVKDQPDPPLDYLLTFRRDGRAEYRITVRAPVRREIGAPFQILEGQVLDLYRAVREAGYADMDGAYPSSGEGRDRAAGDQAYQVRADSIAKEVLAHFQAVPGLERIRKLALSYLPPKILDDTGAAVHLSARSKVVGDVKSRRFFPPDDPRLKDVPEADRRTFESWHDALNADFAPAPGVQPWANPRN